MKTYNVRLSYEDRQEGSAGRTIEVQASSIAGAIGKATREFVKSLDRKQRFDMNKGLKVEAVRSTADKAEVPDAAGQTATPALLSRIRDLSGGRSVRVNVRLVVENAAVAAICAAALADGGATDE